MKRMMEVIKQRRLLPSVEELHFLLAHQASSLVGERLESVLAVIGAKSAVSDPSERKCINCNATQSFLFILRGLFVCL